MTKQAWIPVVTALGVIVLFALAWLPSGQLTEQQRSQKPSVSLVVDVDANNAQLVDVGHDLRGRLTERHEIRLVEQAPADWGITYRITAPAPDQLQIVIVIAGVEPQSYRVQGDIAVQSNLTDRALRLAIDHIGAAERL